MTPSHADVALQAALDGNFRLLKKMSKKVDLRGAKDSKGENSLHFAASKGCLKSCKFLVEEVGIDVNSVSQTGVTPIFYAALEGNVEVMQYLLDRGADPAMANDKGFTPLLNATENGHCEAVKLLLSKGVDVDTLNYRGAPLHVASAKGQDQVVKILLDHGADPNRVANHVFTPLMMACCGESLECMKLLLEAGADPNGNTRSGATPLTEAVDDGLTDIVKLLLDAGADPNIPDEHGVIPIKKAAARGRRELVELLFPRTKPIQSVPYWSVDGIISAMSSPEMVLQDLAPAEEEIASLKSKGREAFARGDYLAAMYFYGLVMEIDPFDATMFANRSICWLRMREGDRALLDARQCKMMRPDWSKAWYREGAALSFKGDYYGALDAFLGALRLDPENEEIKRRIRETDASLRRTAPPPPE